MYVFGGRTQEGCELGDLVAFKINEWRWYKFEYPGRGPSPRSGHSMSVYDKKIYLFGGQPNDGSRTTDEDDLKVVYVLDTLRLIYVEA